MLNDVRTDEDDCVWLCTDVWRGPPKYLRQKNFPTWAVVTPSWSVEVNFNSSYCRRTLAWIFFCCWLSQRSYLIWCETWARHSVSVMMTSYNYSRLQVSWMQRDLLSYDTSVGRFTVLLFSCYWAAYSVVPSYQKRISSTVSLIHIWSLCHIWARSADEDVIYT